MFDALKELWGLKLDMRWRSRGPQPSIEMSAVIRLTARLHSSLSVMHHLFLFHSHFTLAPPPQKEVAGVNIMATAPSFQACAACSRASRKVCGVFLGERENVRSLIEKAPLSLLHVIQASARWSHRWGKVEKIKTQEHVCLHDSLKGRCPDGLISSLVSDMNYPVISSITMETAATHATEQARTCLFFHGSRPPSFFYFLHVYTDWCI